VTDFVGLARANLLFGVVLSDQPLGLVDGLDLLLQGDVSLGRLLCTGHASRVTVPSNLRRRRKHLNSAMNSAMNSE